MFLIAMFDVPLLFAQSQETVESFPLIFQIACIVLTALFLLAFSIGRNPRSWRRLYQAKMAKKEDLSVNKNKKLDEQLKKYGIAVAMLILVVDVAIFVTGVTHEYRTRQDLRTKEEQLQKMNAERFKSGSPDGGNRLFR